MLEVEGEGMVKVGSRFDRVDLGPVRLQPMMPGVAVAI